MKAVAVFPDEKKTSLIDHEEPQIANANQIKIRMLEVVSAAQTARSPRLNTALRPKASST